MMRLLYWGGLAAAATALLTSCRTDVKVAEKEQDLVIDGSVQAKLAPLLKDYAPAKPLRSTDELREIDNKGNLGRLIYYERKVAYAPLESGLWGIHGIGGFTSNDSRGSSQALSLCGLATLISASAGKIHGDATVAVPIGRTFLPFAIQSSIDYGRRSKVRDFEASTPDVCRPSPGQQFSLRVESELTVTVSGTFGTSRVSAMSEELACKVAGELKPADGYLPAVGGQALVTACERRVNGRNKAVLEYVFLPSAGFYVLLKERSDVETVKVRYREVTVAQ
jgi:hypothetical protein